ncbi:MAG: L,D-transpeptidase [Microvirga sp.]
MRGVLSSLVLLAGAVLAGAVLSSRDARAEIAITVDKSTQRMIVVVDGAQRFSWPVSTGMAGYATPDGAFTPSRLARQHYSREWDNAPMPHSIFFTDEGHAIHGSRATSRLGMPASHGCIRLAPAHAALLFDLVQVQGLDQTRIDVTGSDPIATGSGAGPGTGGDFRRLTAFDPLTTGIMAGGFEQRPPAALRARP